MGPRPPDEREWQAREHGVQGRRQWRNVRSLKAVGERIAARHPDRRTAEIRIALMNRVSALGTAEIVCVA